MKDKVWTEKTGVRLPERPTRSDPRSTDTTGRLAQIRDIDARFCWRPPTLSGAGVAGIPATFVFEYGEDAPAGKFPSDLAAMEGYFVLPDECGCRHTLIVGGPGGGKTSKWILGMVLSQMSPDVTQIVVSAKGDMLPWLLKEAREKGVKLVYLAPADPEHSVGCNPLDEVRDRADAELLAKVLGGLCRKGRYETEYFSADAERVLVDTIIRLAESNSPDLNMSTIAAAFQSPLNMRQFAMKHRLGVLEGWLNEHNGNTETSIHTVQNMMKDLMADDVARVTSTSEFRLSSIGTEPCLLVIDIPEFASTRLKGIVTIFMALIIRFLYENASKNPDGRLKHQTYVYIDEMASAVGQLPIADKVATARSRRIGFVFAVQGISQIYSRYGDDAPALLAGISNYIAVPPVDAEDARFLSARSGLTRVEEAEMMGREVRVRHVERPLLTPYEIQSVNRDPMLGNPCWCFFADTPPFAVFAEPIFNWRAYREFGRKLWDGEVDINTLLPTRKTPLGLPPSIAALERGKIVRGNRTVCSYCGGWDPRLTDCEEWDSRTLQQRIDALLESLRWFDLTGPARTWFNQFIKENKRNKHAIIRLLEQLPHSAERPLEGFFNAAVAAETECIQAVLYYYRYMLARDSYELRHGRRESFGFDEEY